MKPDLSIPFASRVPNGFSTKIRPIILRHRVKCVFARAECTIRGSIVPMKKLEQDLRRFLGNTGNRGNFLDAGFFQTSHTAKFFQ